MTKVPILLNVFNRLDYTKDVFSVIQEYKPDELFIHADGPRNSKDILKCNAVRSYLKNNINWECNTHLLFREDNLGCGKGPASAITWFFNNVDYGIILEDDCIPDLSFFTFSNYILEKYKDDTKITSLTGSNFQDDKMRSNGSYYFSNHNRIWGWATWKRVWCLYDYYINDFDKSKYRLLQQISQSNDEYKYWIQTLNNVKENRMNDSCWDYQFMYLQWKLKGLTVTSNINLVKNIGDGIDATHTNWVNDHNLHRTTFSMSKIKDPNQIKINQKADKYYIKNYILYKKSISDRIINKIKTLLNSL